MNSWAEEIRQSPVFPNLSQINKALYSIEPPPEPDSEEAQLIERIKYLCNHVERRLAVADPRLVSGPALNGLADQSNNLKAHVDSYIENRHFDDVSQRLKSDVDGLLAAVGQIPPEPWEAEDEVVRSAAESLRNSFADVEARTGLISEEIVEQRESSRKEFEELERKTNDTLNRLDRESSQRLSSLEETVGRRTNEFTGRADNIEKEAETQTRRLESFITEIQAQFSRSQEDRVSKFAGETAKQNEQFEQQMKANNETFNTTLETFTKSSTALKDSLESINIQAREVLGVAAASGTAGAYLKDADEQRKQANLWRWVSVASFILTIIAGYFTLQLFDTSVDGNTPRTVFIYLSRTILLFAPLTLAGYATRESSQHRRRERESKKLANELTTFRPFLAELETEEIKEIIREASKRYFPGYQTEHSS